MRVAISTVLGVFTFVALFPFAGEDSDPPTFFSVFGYEVPSGDVWLALVAGVGVGVEAWWLLRRRPLGS